MNTAADSTIAGLSLADIYLDAVSAEEIRRRIEEVESGEADLIDHEIAMKSARELVSAGV